MMRRRVVLEIVLLFALAAGAGAAVSRGLLAPAAVEGVARAVPPAAPEIVPEAPAMDPPPGVAQGNAGAVGAAEPEPVPRVRREGARFVVDLRGVSDPAALIAGLQLTPAPAPPGGFLIRVASPTAPLAQAGVRDGDVLETINGRATRESGEALAALVAASQSPAVSFRLRRGGGRVTVTVGVAR